MLLVQPTNNKTGDVTQYTYGQGTAKPHAVTGKTDRMPLVGSFVLDNGNPYCTRQQVDLNNISMGYPLDYMASENADFSGAAWQTYSINPAFTISSGYGTKKIYFKVRNANGESAVKSDDIEFLHDTDGDGNPDIYDSDDDNDGIPDVADASPLDPANALLDPDGDGLSNLQEYLNNTNPNLADSDSDGWNDYDEVYVYHTNPNKADSDNDGLNDPDDANPRNPYNEGYSENYSIKQWGLNAGGAALRISESYQVVNDKVGGGLSKGAYADADGDGMPDSWEVSNGLNPSDYADALSDADGDGLTNYQEYINQTNPNLADSDNDGWSDYEEIFLYHTDPMTDDTDGDGVKDSLDPVPNGDNRYSISTNYSVRGWGFNAGGGIRGSETYSLSDAIGQDMKGGLINAPSLSISPESVNFANASLNVSSAATVILQNEGNDNVVIYPLAITGGDTVEFTLKNDNCSNRVLSPFIACTVDVELLPRSVGAKGVVLNIQYYDAETKYASVSVSGIAQADIAPPDTIITAGPDSPSNSSMAVFSFTSTEPNSTFECQMDGLGYSSCSSPKTYEGLADGGHIFMVRATDIADNTDPSPASYTWTIDTSPDVIPTADFTASPLTGSAPLTVNFMDASTGGNPPLNYQWDFVNDGTTDSILQNPIYTYNAEGTYSVKLTVTDLDGDSNSLAKINYIRVSPQEDPNYPVAIAGTALHYPTLQDAYDAAWEGDTIQIKATGLTENLYIDVNKVVTIQGGYNGDFTAVTGKTTLNGNMTVTNGTIFIRYERESTERW